MNKTARVSSIVLIILISSLAFSATPDLSQSSGVFDQPWRNRRCAAENIAQPTAAPFLYDKDGPAEKSAEMGSACQLTEFSGTPYWIIFYWDYGDASVQYIDPAECGGSPVYPFQITSLQFSLYTSTANPSYVYMSFPVSMEIVVYDLKPSGNPCDGPGELLYHFPLTATEAGFKYPTVGTAAFPGRCCVERPFFIGVTYTDTRLGRDTLPPCILADSNKSRDLCYQYFYDVSAGGVWQNWNQHFTDTIGYQNFVVNGITDCDSCIINPDKIIASLPYTDQGSTVGYTDEFDIDCGGGRSQSPDVVYSYTPTVDEDIYISLCNSDYDTKLFVYRNGVSDYAACNEDYCGDEGLQSRIWWLGLEAGNTYYIVVDGWGDQSGNYEITVDYFQDIIVQCPAGGMPEGEPSGCDFPDTTNGGCNYDPPMFGFVSCGDTICGTAGRYSSKGTTRRDTDWYQFTVSTLTNVTFAIEAEFPAICGIVPTDPPGTGNCSQNTGSIKPNVMTMPGEKKSFSVILDAGTYWLFVAPRVYYLSPCDADYVVTMSCQCGHSVEFDAGTRWGVGGVNVVFQNNSHYDLTPVSWKWEFGDGQVSYLQSPTHYYSTPGWYDVTLTMTDGCGVIALTKRKFVYVAASTQLSFQIYDSPGEPVISSRAIDVDHDNNADLLFCDIPPRDDLMIAFGRGDGSFENPLEFTTGYGPFFDFGFINKDTLLDIIVADSGAIVIMLNNGNRTFSSTILPRFGAGAGNVVSVATGYFDDDPYVDFVIEPYRVHFGDSLGTFSRYANLPAWIRCSAIADFNGDGFDDVLAVGSDSAYICISHGDGSFTCHSALGNPPHDASLEAATNNGFADFNRDGNVDFAYVLSQYWNYGSGSYAYYGYVMVGYGDGLGGVIRADTIPIYGWPYGIKLVDVNRDYNLDLAVCNHSACDLEIYFGDEEGNFNELQVISIPSYNFPSVAAADFDRDGNPDFAAGLYNYPDGPWSVLRLINTLPDAPVLEDEMTTTGLGGVTLNVQNPDSFAISMNFTTVAGANYWRHDMNNDRVLDEAARDFNLQNGEYRIIIKPRGNTSPDGRFHVGIRINGSVQVHAFENYSTGAFLKSLPNPSDSFIFYYTVEPVSSMLPPNGQPTYERRPIFDWTNLNDNIPLSDSFHFQLDRYYDFTTPIYDVSGLLVPTFHPPSNLGYDSVYYWRIRSFKDGAWSEFSRTIAAYIVACNSGDANGNGVINILDVTYIISYLFKGGPPPAPLESGDANGNEVVNILDATYLIAYLYKGGPAPVCP
ncbi:MAG: FG-GAP-like repeat-containing protein [Candidatus Zixiibacteriota bacterium]